jgi:PAS domain S-box-containing protein
VRLQAKVLLVALPLAAVFAGLTAYVGSRATETLMVRELGRRLRPQAEEFAAGLAHDWDARKESALLARLQRAQAFSGAEYAEALSPEGAVVAHTNVLETGKRRDDPDARDALAAQASVSVRARGPRGPLLVLSAPIWRADEEFLISGGPRKRLGTLRLGIPLAATLDSASRVGSTVAAMSAGFCLVALALTLGFVRVLLLRPVQAIEAAISRVAAGDYAAEVPVFSRDELGSLASAFNGMGQALSRTVVSRDRLEEALAIARTTLDASADGILVVDKNLHAITFNRRFVEMWSLTDDLMRGGDVRAMAEFVKDQVEDSDVFMRLATGIEERDQERRDTVRLKDGRVFDRIAKAYRIGGQTVGRTITTRDLTLHLEGVRALAEARDEALETAGAKSQFLANVSHELRTPLNAVVGSAQLLAGTKLDPEQREHADTLEQAAKALLGLVDSVLDFSKIEAGRMLIERAVLKPGDLLSDAAKLLGPRAAEKGLSLKVDSGEAGALELLGDPTRLRQVLLNLLANAVKFTERGEVVAAVRVLSQSESWVELEFSVRDTGIGIPPEQSGRLFSPFTQGDGSTTRRYGGTGLGLAISRSLVELMGGEIGFESVPARGARFWVRLRLDRAGEAAAPAPAAPPLPARSSRRDRLRVMIVEDNATNRRLFERQLARLGCPCASFESGSAALERLRADDFGLILLDCQMPGLDGYATAAEIRRAEVGRRRTPIVAITANAAEEDRRRCLEAGMDDFVSKPVTLESLAAALDRWDRPFDEIALGVFSAVAADGPASLAGLLEGFLADAETRLASAASAVARGDLGACARDAHTIKGASSSVGARGLTELCRRLEAAAAAKAPLDDFSSLLAQAGAEIARLRADAVRWTA